MAGARDSFYDQLPPIRAAQDVFIESLYAPAPRDWLLAFSDIRASSAAVAAGHHPDVNFAAAAMIAALTNVAGQIPYQFGGDGAVALVPPGDSAIARRVLARVRTFAAKEFRLDLRIALAPVAALHERGARVLVGRYERSPGSAYAVFRGGGIEMLELAVKGRGDASLATLAMIRNDEDDGEPPDLTGLSCRWTPVRAERGQMVSLVLRCRNHREIHGELARIAGLETLSAVSQSALKPRWPPPGLLREAKARHGRLPLPLMIVAVAVETLVAYFFVRFRWNAGSFNANRYVREVAEGAIDFACADENLAVVFDCPSDRIRALRDYLDERNRQGDVRYGMHVADHAVMTCLVISPSYAQHVHFVDGGDGGYTRAATQLKAKAPPAPPTAVNLRTTAESAQS